MCFETVVFQRLKAIRISFHFSDDTFPSGSTAFPKVVISFSLPLACQRSLTAGGLHSLQGEENPRPVGRWAKSGIGGMAFMSPLLACGTPAPQVCLGPDQNARSLPACLPADSVYVLCRVLMSVAFCLASLGRT